VLHSAPMRLAGIGFAVLAVACAAALAGCGGGDNGLDTAAGRAAQAYVNAYNARDYAKVCDLLSESYKEERSIGPGGGEEEGEERSGCAPYFRAHTKGALIRLAVDDVQVDGKNATAHVTANGQDAFGGESKQLVRLQEKPNGSWLVEDVTTG